MAREIEHKYLVANDSFIRLSTHSIQIAQGYLCREPHRTVRIRICGNRAFITIKGATKVDTRQEFEYDIPLNEAHELLSMCDGTIIKKTRYIVPYENFVWEVDVFHGALEPLIVAEIELPSSDTKYALPPFVGKDVTGDSRYFNSNL